MPTKTSTEKISAAQVNSLVGLHVAQESSWWTGEQLLCALQNADDEARASQLHTHARAEQVSAALSEASERMNTALRRKNSLKSTHLHLGPTNSGKTHDALLALAEAGSGVYAGPLRMLAREAYDKLVLLAGEENVGMITGEEKINEHAPIIAATCEAAPTRGTLLVLDEAHWLSDPQRGWAWTRLLIGGQFTHMHIIADRSSETLLTALTADSEHTTVQYHERLTPLTYRGSKDVLKVPPKTAVVAFSRPAVLALATHFEKAGRPAAVLYGALPPAARREQVRRLIDGEVDVVCCTDVIGHGINLPINAVAVAEGEKFDGTVRRALHMWELAQIVGRAGRFGHSSEGAVFCATGLGWFSADSARVSKATRAAAGKISTGWSLHRATLRPTLEELGATKGEDLLYLLPLWSARAERFVTNLPVDLVDVRTLLERVSAVLGTVQQLDATIDVRTVWRLATCPVDDVDLICAGAAAQCGNSTWLRPYVHEAKVYDTEPLERAEEAARTARNLRALVGSLGHRLPTLSYADCERLETNAADAVMAALRRKRTNYGRCQDCNKPCAPWFRRCDNCHSSRNYYYSDYGRW